LPRYQLTGVGAYIRRMSIVKGSQYQLENVITEKINAENRKRQCNETRGVHEHHTHCTKWTGLFIKGVGSGYGRSVNKVDWSRAFYITKKGSIRVGPLTAYFWPISK